MRKYSTISIIFVGLFFAGCDSKRPGILEDLLSTETHDWLDRDATEDPFEKPNGECCNDYLPYALPLDTTINAVINPEDDLDYYYINLLDNSLGYLLLRTDSSDIRLRLFTTTSIDGDDELPIAVDSVIATVGSENRASYQWTYVTASNKQLRLLVHGDDPSVPLHYQVQWKRIIPTVGLDLLQAGGSAIWERGVQRRIRWSSSFSSGVTVGLVSSDALVNVLKRDITGSNELDWEPSLDLTPGEYQIIIYLSDDPAVAEVSDVITIQ